MLSQGAKGPGGGGGLNRPAAPVSKRGARPDCSAEWGRWPGGGGGGSFWGGGRGVGGGCGAFRGAEENLSSEGIGAELAKEKLFRLPKRLGAVTVGYQCR